MEPLTARKPVMGTRSSGIGKVVQSEGSRRVSRWLSIILTCFYIREDAFDEIPVIVWWVLLLLAVVLPIVLGIVWR
jgi:hypothetical protein